MDPIKKQTILGSLFFEERLKMAVAGLRFSHLDPQQIKGKNILIRVDFNGLKKPRLEASVSSVNHAINNGANTVFLLSHNGRPDELKKQLISAAGKKANLKEIEAEVREQLSLRNAVSQLEVSYIGNTVSPNLGNLRFLGDIIGDVVTEVSSQKQPGSIVLLENTRFYSGDIQGDIELAQAIVEATQAEIVVEDGFSVLHRAEHASVGGIAIAVREKGGLATLGIAADEEVGRLLGAFVENPERPYVGVFGGSKVSGLQGKIVILKNLLERLDKAIIGGAMVYPFLIAMHGRGKVGEDPIADIREEGELDSDIAAAHEILRTYRGKVILPRSYIAQKDDRVETFSLEEENGIPPGFVIRDVDPQDLQEILERQNRIHGRICTFVFNGSVGKTPEFPDGTNAVFDFMTQATTRFTGPFAYRNAKTAIAGGDTTSDVKRARKAGRRVEVSVEPTGGGAFLKLLETGTLPIEEHLTPA